MRRDLFLAGSLWLLLTLAGEWLVAGTQLAPLAASEEARVVDGAFRLLTLLAVPVAALVLAALIYSPLRFRVPGQPTADGPPIHTSRPVALAWVLGSAALTAVVIVNPGLTGLAELRREQPADLMVEVEGARWYWTVTYPDHGVRSRQEMVLPAGRRVRFEVSSLDVLHAFWVPAFRMKVDALPGRKTVVYVTPSRTGDLGASPGFRLQCAELCGLGHAGMVMPVRVVEPAEFEAWISQQEAAP